MLTVTKWLVIGLLALFVTPAMAITVCNQTNHDVSVFGYAQSSLGVWATPPAWRVPNLAPGAACIGNSNLAGKTLIVTYYNCELQGNLPSRFVFPGTATVYLTGQCNNGAPGACQCDSDSTFNASTQK